MFIVSIYLLMHIWPNETKFESKPFGLGSHPLDHHINKVGRQLKISRNSYKNSDI